MDLKKIPVFSSVSERMAWLSQRQKVVAHNLANADTPHFQPSDLKPLDFKEMTRQKMTGSEMAATSPAHFAAGPSGASLGNGFDEKKQKVTYETTLTGNAVSIEEQMVKMNQTSLDYEETTGLYRKQLNMIKEALGRGR